MKKYILALDQGTTSSRAVLFDKQQNIVGMVQREFTQIFPREGWVEHDPMEIYSTQYGVMVELLAQYNIPAAEIAAIGITNQRETTVLWDRHTGLPVYNAIVWQCRRSADIVDRLKKEGLGDYIKKTTGLVADAYFSGTKIKWLFDNVEGLHERAKSGDVLFGTVDCWLLWKLTHGAVHATDYTNASRTMLFNINTLDWDETLLKKLDVPRACLPQVKPSGFLYGSVKLPDGEIPIASIAGDQQAALFGQCCFEKGEAKNTYGTGCFLLMNCGGEPCNSKSGLIATIAAGTIMLRIIVPSNILTAISQPLTGVMRGSGDTVTPMFITLMQVVVVRIPLIILFTRLWNTIEAVYWSQVAANLYGLIHVLIVHKYGKWRNRAYQTIKNLGIELIE